MQKRLSLGVFAWLVVLGVSACVAEPDAGQKQALAAIERAGGDITRDETSPRKPVVGIWFVCGSSATDATLVHLKSFPDLQELVILSEEVTDKGLEHVKGLANLKSLAVYEVNMTDQGLEHLKNLSKLETLKVYDAKITDQGLEHLKGMTSLRTVLLYRSPGVTEAGAKELARVLPKARVTWRQGNTIKEFPSSR